MIAPCAGPRPSGACLYAFYRFVDDAALDPIAKRNELEDDDYNLELLIRGKFRGARDKTGTTTTGWVPAALLKEPVNLVTQELQDFIDTLLSHVHNDFGIDAAA